MASALEKIRSKILSENHAQKLTRAQRGDRDSSSGTNQKILVEDDLSATSIERSSRSESSYKGEPSSNSGSKQSKQIEDHHPSSSIKRSSRSESSYQSESSSNSGSKQSKKIEVHLPSIFRGRSSRSELVIETSLRPALAQMQKTKQFEDRPPCVATVRSIHSKEGEKAKCSRHPKAESRPRFFTSTNSARQPMT
uniref:AlNc14C43G3559 protein n=1 Tax=Albugo laibachii Nc14 TaxID=890382 RepID=F0WA15_9STRA|nr:AlNc14C43G3559 [Albugo laibachii Nc14]CCA27729.1 AlNc14C656G12345 [Albugo laibachii Nc14]|eukprot:CCA27729.1 AlNc14C656G12345 [Albugo laibachii Nc14]